MHDFHYRDGVLHAENVALDRLAADVRTPLYCYSTATLTRQYQAFAAAFSGLDASIRYAMKANANLAVVRTLARLGAGADVVSEGELRVALKAGVTPQSIVFSGVGKTDDELVFALEVGIDQFNVESEAELVRLSDLAVARRRRAPVAIRVNPGVDAGTHAKISTGGEETKFGVAFTRARQVFAGAGRLPGIAIKGVAVHIGSQLTRLGPFEAAFRRVAELTADLRQDGHAITTLDLGGGLGIPYDQESDAPPLPAAYAAMVRRLVGHLGCRLIFEPGRLLVGNAGILLARVITVKQATSRRFLVIDAAMNDLIRPTLYDAYHHMIPVREPATGADRRLFDVVGPVCETGDVLGHDRMLPAMEAGDLLAILSAGAYGAVMSSTYNGRPLIPEVMVDGARAAVVRRRPTYDEMERLESFPDWLADKAAAKAGVA